MAESTNVKSGGIGFVGLLTILFIALKLIGVVAWSWWWVLSPIWIVAGMTILILLFVLAGAGVALLVSESKKKK